MRFGTSEGREGSRLIMAVVFVLDGLCERAQPTFLESVPQSSCPNLHRIAVEGSGGGLVFDPPEEEGEAGWQLLQLLGGDSPAPVTHRTTTIENKVSSLINTLNHRLNGHP